MALRKIDAYTVSLDFAEELIFKYGALETVTTNNNSQFVSILLTHSVQVSSMIEVSEITGRTMKACWAIIHRVTIQMRTVI